MKKLIALALTAAMTMSLAACGSSASTSTASTPASDAPAESTASAAASETTSDARVYAALLTTPTLLRSAIRHPPAPTPPTATRLQQLH